MQVDEIYHDESLGVHINIALVRLIMVGYRQVNHLVSRQGLGGEGLWGQSVGPAMAWAGGTSIQETLSPESEPEAIRIVASGVKLLEVVSSD